LSTMAARPPFPFIVACGRSGTTLVQAMLNAHPEMAIPPEAHFLLPVRDRVTRRGGGVDLEGFVAILDRNRSFALWNVSAEEVQRALARTRPRDYPGAVRTLYAAYARRHDKGRYGDKTPKHVLNLPYLAEAFPEARFIHLVRDGRDVTCSFMARGIGPRDGVEGALRWKRAVATGRRDGARLGPDRYLEVRYEDLVADPEGHIKGIAEFIELDYDEVMLEYRGQVDGMLPNPYLKDLHENVYRPPTEHLRDWRREMDPVEVAMFEVLAGDLLSELGYERAVPHPSPMTRMEARRRWVRVNAERIVRKARRWGAQEARGVDEA
jgi:hypothetical protein